MKKVRRIMRKMGLKGIAPSPRTTKTTKTHYDNLLKTDITYIRTKGRFTYEESTLF